MTDVEITSKAEDHLEAMDSEARERMIQKLAEAREWTEHRLEPLSNFPTIRYGLATTGRSSRGIGPTIGSS